MFPLKLRDTANSDYKERKFSRGARGKNARETRGATNVRFFPLSTPTHVCITPGIIYMEMRIGIDFTSKPVTEPASGDRLSRHLTSIKFSSVENQKASEFPLPPPLLLLLLACNLPRHRPNFHGCEFLLRAPILEASKHARLPSPHLFFFFFFFFRIIVFWNEEGGDSSTFQVFDGQNRETGGGRVGIST